MADKAKVALKQLVHEELALTVSEWLENILGTSYRNDRSGVRLVLYSME